MLAVNGLYRLGLFAKQKDFTAEYAEIAERTSSKSSLRNV
jgi:hypothetical protein